MEIPKFENLVDSDYLPLVDKHKWIVRPGYQDLPHTRLEDGRMISIARYILVNICGEEIAKSQQIVHINGNRRDNRRANLKIVGRLAHL